MYTYVYEIGKFFWICILTRLLVYKLDCCFPTSALLRSLRRLAS